MKPFQPKPDYTNPRDIRKEFKVNFEFLKDEFQKDPNAVNSKYKKDFYTRIVTRAFILLQTRKMTDPSFAAKYSEFSKFVDKLKKEKFDLGENAQDEDVAVADTFLDYLITAIDK
ncbi:MAG: hypothetical protein WCT44_01795 [Candidatus Paceibacterota bacterium]